MRIVRTYASAYISRKPFRCRSMYIQNKKRKKKNHVMVSVAIRTKWLICAHWAIEFVVSMGLFHRLRHAAVSHWIITIHRDPNEEEKMNSAHKKKYFKTMNFAELYFLAWET